MNAESCVSFCDPSAASMDSFYNAASQGSVDGSSPFRAFPGSSDKFGSAFLAGKGQSFGDSGGGGSSSGGGGGGGGSNNSPKRRSRYSQPECPSLDGSGAQQPQALPTAAASATTAFNKYHLQQQQQQQPPLYGQRGSCKSPPSSNLKLQDASAHNGALQLSCFAPAGCFSGPPRARPSGPGIPARLLSAYPSKFSGVLKLGAGSASFLLRKAERWRFRASFWIRRLKWKSMGSHTGRSDGGRERASPNLPEEASGKETRRPLSDFTGRRRLCKRPNDRMDSHAAELNVPFWDEQSATINLTAFSCDLKRTKI
ncbi:homeobox protein aristaless-like 4 [Crotalus adamanteus]|uniref:Homeobox protein aristaless-like 4 n=1 Tax=Crotalus adamanteus TaxID=8729 RepID=A0AAW1C8I0_CROAD